MPKITHTTKKSKPKKTKQLQFEFNMNVKRLYLSIKKTKQTKIDDYDE